MKYRKKRGEEREMDMTPMIDIVFQLIIFFIVTINLEKDKLKPIELAPSPEGPAASRPPRFEGGGVGLPTGGLASPSGGRAGARGRAPQPSASAATPGAKTRASSPTNAQSSMRMTAPHWISRASFKICEIRKS